MKNPLVRFNSRSERTEKPWTSTEMTYSEEIKEWRRMNRTPGTYGTPLSITTYIIWEAKEKGMEKYLKKNGWKLLRFEDMNLHSQGTQRAPRRSLWIFEIHQRHIIIKFCWKPNGNSWKQRHCSSEALEAWRPWDDDNALIGKKSTKNSILAENYSSKVKKKVRHFQVNKSRCLLLVDLPYKKR